MLSRFGEESLDALEPLCKDVTDWFAGIHMLVETAAID